MPIWPAEYDSWYRTPRGHWISEQEFALLLRLLNPREHDRLLDVGCGTGHFTRRFARAGLAVTGVDPDPAMLDYAHKHSGGIEYLEASAETLPFTDEQFDYCTAITSLCFVNNPVKALQEMWRVSKHGLLLGLLNRHSLLYRQKAGKGAYAGARWDTLADVLDWLNQGGIPAVHYQVKSAIFYPRGGKLGRLIEKVIPAFLPWGGFLAVFVVKGQMNR